MFRNWGFLISEMVLLILIAALLGLLIGWLIWGRRSGSDSAQADADRARKDAETARGTAARLQDELDACNRARAGADTRLQILEAEKANAARTATTATAAGANNATSNASAPASETPAESAKDTGVSSPAATKDAATKEASSQDDGDRDYDGDGTIEGTNEGTKPVALTGPRDGKADDLKQIKGVGPKLEKTCNSLGFWHFDQIAAWTGDEVAWVDANLTGFKGRVSRDNWVEQAKLLASGAETEFSARVKKGDVY